MFIPAKRRKSGLSKCAVFQSLDWVDVYSGSGHSHSKAISLPMFQSLDWVDVYSGPCAIYSLLSASGRFNPSTGLMFIPAPDAPNWK